MRIIYGIIAGRIGSVGKAFTPTAIGAGLTYGGYKMIKNADNESTKKKRLAKKVGGALSMGAGGLALATGAAHGYDAFGRP